MRPTRILTPLLLAVLLGVAPFAGAAASWDSASWDSASWDSASWDSASWDSASWDSASWDSASWDSATWDSATWDSATWDSATWDSATWDSATWDSATWDSATWDSATWDASSWDLAMWGYAAIGAPAPAPASGTLVCIVDSGIDGSHPALAGRLVASKSFVGDDGLDRAGHGTHLAGIVARVGGAQLASAKALDDTGHGETEDVTAAIGWCSSIGADVILLALSEDAPTPAFEKAVKAAAKGAVIVASAGNHAGAANTPADLPHVIGVGALAPDGSVASFSATGSKVDVYAPGVLVGSTVPGGGFRVASGTSQAAAFVAGAAAWMLAVEPSLSPSDVEKALSR